MERVRSTRNTHTAKERKYSSQGRVIEHRCWPGLEAQDRSQIFCLIQQGNTYISVSCFKAMIQKTNKKKKPGKHSPKREHSAQESSQAQACQAHRVDIWSYLCYSLLWFQNWRMLPVPKHSAKSFPELCHQWKIQGKKKNESKQKERSKSELCLGLPENPLGKEQRWPARAFVSQS